MRMKNLLTLGVVMAGLALVLTTPAHSQRPAPQSAPPQALPTPPSPLGVPPGPVPEETLTQRLARKAKLKEEDVVRLLTLLAPEVQADLARGKSVKLAGLGTFRVVQVPEHRDLGPDGRPITVPASNT